MYIQYIQGLSRSRIGTTDHVSYVAHATMTVLTLEQSYVTSAKFKPPIFSVWPCLVRYSEHFHFHDFECLLLVAYMIILRNRKRAEFGKPRANREPMCASENCHWCGHAFRLFLQLYEVGCRRHYYWRRPDCLTLCQGRLCPCSLPRRGGGEEIPGWWCLSLGLIFQRFDF
jgi:hypothetical protein